MTIVHPLPDAPSIGINHQMMDTLRRVKSVALMLAHQGFRIIDIQMNPIASVITIMPEARCANLGAAEIGRNEHRGGMDYTMVVSHEGVDVQWTITKRRSMP
ncbi:hypothetical protein [Nitrosospira sp. NpAV]|uniref:hypothetical protein n=1 Tax=Nitrosospira sp. NpAV TaxID=58133 RepID=UPI0005A2D0CC|nr:hypothetical protein [Nitrosospira sp. NpAV]KIO49621.1 hypothetical protein SQ11_05750 [Nitrosospira sp. NpAV]